MCVVVVVLFFFVVFFPYGCTVLSRFIRSPVILKTRKHK